MEGGKEEWRGKAIMGKEVDEGSVELKLTKNKEGTERLLEDQSWWDKTIRSQRMSWGSFYCSFKF